MTKEKQKEQDTFFALPVKERWLYQLKQIEEKHEKADDKVWITSNEAASMVQWAKDIFEGRYN